MFLDVLDSNTLTIIGLALAWKKSGGGFTSFPKIPDMGPASLFDLAKDMKRRSNRTNALPDG